MVKYVCLQLSCVVLAVIESAVAVTRLKLFFLLFFYLGALGFLFGTVWAFAYNEEIWPGYVAHPYANYGFAFAFCTIAFLAAGISVTMSPDKIRLE